MRIVQLIPTLNRGGAEKLAVNLANGLAAKNEVIFITLFDESDWNENNFKCELDNNIKFISLNKRLGLDFKIFFKLLKLIINLKPNVVHNHLASFNYLIPTIILLSNKVKFFHTIHNDSFKENNNYFTYITRKFFFKNHYVKPITISKSSKESFTRQFNLDSNLIENAIIKPKLNVDNSIKDLFLNLKSTYKKIFINIGRFAPQKNQLALIEAFKDKGLEDYCLLIIGGGRLDPELDEKIKLINSPNVYLLGELDNPQDYLINCDAFVLSSIFEGLPITLIESLSLGIPVISTKVGGIPDIIKEDYNGFLFEEINTNSFINKFKELGDYDFNSLKNNCIETYNDKFNIQKFIEKHTEIYQK
ncbi:glycosyltransferase [Empedobacter falsenii]|uniref:glycosyltransferase n=1 Tax=Empedobacter falsenii TaxID=343874 RepID=UPI003A8036EB